MDRVDEYRDILEGILDKHHRIPFSHGEIESRFIIDRDRNNFVLMNVGWDGDRRIHGCVVHVEIINGKIWIHRDGIEDGITDELVMDLSSGGGQQSHHYRSINGLFPLPTLQISANF